MIKLLHGDCLELMKDIPDNSIDCCITSPPYDDLRTYENSLNWNFDIFSKIALELIRVLKKGGVIVWVVNDASIKGSETGTSFRQALFFKDNGLNIHDTMIWDKASCAFPSKNRYYQSFEYMFVFSKGSPKNVFQISDRPNKWAGTKTHGTSRQKNGSLKQITKRIISDFGVRFNIWRISNPGKKGTIHPATFPEALVNDHLISWTKEKDIILDPFMGSGTTGAAAANLKRQFIGIEKEEKYFNIAKNRIFLYE